MSLPLIPTILHTEMLCSKLTLETSSISGAVIQGKGPGQAKGKPWEHLPKRNFGASWVGGTFWQGHHPSG